MERHSGSLTMISLGWSWHVQSLTNRIPWIVKYIIPLAARKPPGLSQPGSSGFFETSYAQQSSS